MGFKQRELNEPGAATVKLLFANSGNQCAFNKGTKPCTNKIVTKECVTVGQICHINGVKGKCHVKGMHSSELHGYENLVLLCGKHHKIIDAENTNWSAQTIRRMKAEHEVNFVNNKAKDTAQIAKQLLENMKLYERQEPALKALFKLRHELHEKITARFIMYEKHHHNPSGNEVIGEHSLHTEHAISDYLKEWGHLCPPPIAEKLTAAQDRLAAITGWHEPTTAECQEAGAVWDVLEEARREFQLFLGLA